MFGLFDIQLTSSRDDLLSELEESKAKYEVSDDELVC